MFWTLFSRDPFRVGGNLLLRIYFQYIVFIADYLAGNQSFFFDSLYVHSIRITILLLVGFAIQFKQCIL